jgi:hypothetical protein
MMPPHRSTARRSGGKVLIANRPRSRIVAAPRPQAWS